MALGDFIETRAVLGGVGICKTGSGGLVTGFDGIVCIEGLRGHGGGAWRG